MGVGTGRFICFEGIDGAGKSTHISWFADRLRQRGHTVLLTREPGGSPLAEQIRGLLLNEAMQPQTELLLAFAARAEHLTTTIEPALAVGQIVISDRFTDSTYAYQGAGRGLDWATIAGLERFVQQGCQPDLTVFFDLAAPQAAARRAKVRLADRFEAESIAFFERVRNGYLRRIAEQPARYAVIDAQLSIDEIKVLLEEIVEKY